MKRLTFFTLSTLILIGFACNTGEIKENNSDPATVVTEAPVNETTKVPADFVEFWGKFKNMVAKNDKAGIMAVSSESMKDFFNTQYDSFMNKRMKEEVAKASVKEIEDRGEMGKLFIYKVITGPENEYTANYMTYGFWFKIVDGKWLINEPQMGG